MGLDIYFYKRKNLTNNQKKIVEKSKARIKELIDDDKKLENIIKEILDNRFENDKTITLSAVYDKRANLMYLRACKTDFESEMGVEDIKLLDDAEQFFANNKDINDVLEKMQVNVDEQEKISEEIEEIFGREEIAYFRKVNFLMAYFNYEGNCEYVEITKDEVSELVERATKVWNNHNLANELLPTQSGFFFGGTSYNDWYFDDVKEVRNKFQEILDNTNWEKEVVEMYCWW